MADAARVTDAVYAALARQLRLTPEEVRDRAHQPLEQLGLDSHGLLRVLLDVERALALAKSLDLADAALESPASMAAGILTAVGAG